MFVFPTLAILSAISQTAKQNPIQTNGYLDVYYEHNFARSGTGPTLDGRGLDIANNDTTLSFAELDFSKAVAARDPLGFTLMLYTGKGPDLINLAEPGGKSKYKLFRQAYVTYQTSGKSPVTFDLGKFDTWIGYEGIDNRYQDQYSRSFNWTYSETTYETGLRASAKLSSKLNGALYVVQGWNEVEDANNGKSWGVTLNYAPDANSSYVIQNHSGTEGSTHANDIGSYGGIGFANPGTSHVDLVDFIASRQVTPKTRVAFNVDYANSNKDPNKGKWNGEVLYVRRQLSAPNAASLRLDRFEDSDGLRTGAAVKLYSATTGFDHTFTPNLTARLEARYDISNNPFFVATSGLENNRTTFTVAAIAKF